LQLIQKMRWVEQFVSWFFCFFSVFFLIPSWHQCKPITRSIKADGPCFKIIYLNYHCSLDLSCVRLCVCARATNLPSFLSEPASWLFPELRIDEHWKQMDQYMWWIGDDVNLTWTDATTLATPHPHAPKHTAKKRPSGAWTCRYTSFSHHNILLSAAWVATDATFLFCSRCCEHAVATRGIQRWEWAGIPTTAIWPCYHYPS
jgi:hypothetical protein